MANLKMLIEARVESLPERLRELIISRPGVISEWRTELPALLDQLPATPTLVEL